MAGPGSPGPKYWNSTYGLETFADFSAAATPYLEDPPFWLRLSDLPLADELAAAYTDPFEVIGSYLSIKLSGANEGLTLVKSNAIAANHPSQSPLNPENATMTTLVIPDAFQGVIHSTLSGRDIDNVVGMVNADGNSPDAAAALLAAWQVADGPLSLLPATVSVVDYKVTDLRSDSGEITVLASGATGGLTAGIQPATRGACALVGWNGSSRSRSTRGRLYFGPIAESFVDADGASLVSGRQADIEAAFNAFLASLSDAGYDLAVLSRKLLLATLVTAATVEETIATQRRRIRG